MLGLLGGLGVVNQSPGKGEGQGGPERQQCCCSNAARVTRFRASWWDPDLRMNLKEVVIRGLAVGTEAKKDQRRS